MKKEVLSAVIVVIILTISGITYSCSYSKGKNNDQNISLREDFSQEDPSLGDLDDTDLLEAKEENEVKEEIYIHICGAILRENVYKVEEGTRLVEVIELAGGLLEDAASDFINQAMIVEDGERIYIPTKAELAEMETKEYIEGENSAPTQDGKASNGLININKANLAELMELPGIGEAKAKNIIEYRESNGGFNTIEEIMNISGIKEGMFSKIMSLISVK